MLKMKMSPVQQTSWSPPSPHIFVYFLSDTALLSCSMSYIQDVRALPHPAPPLELVNPGGLNKHAGFKCSAQTLPPLPLLSVGKFQRKFYFLPQSPFSHCPLSVVCASLRNKLKNPTESPNIDSFSSGPPSWPEF